jgi:hypothetical protein
MGTPDSVLGEYAEPGTESAGCLLSAAPVFRRNFVNCFAQPVAAAIVRKNPPILPQYNFVGAVGLLCFSLRYKKIFSICSLSVLFLRRF